MLLEQAVDCEPGLHLARLLNSNSTLGVKPFKTTSQCGNYPFLMTRVMLETSPVSTTPLQVVGTAPPKGVLLFTLCKTVTLGMGYPTATELPSFRLYLCTWREQTCQAWKHGCRHDPAPLPDLC